MRSVWTRIAGSLLAALAVRGGTVALADDPAPLSGRSAAASVNAYWLIAADGNVYTSGDAPFHGSLAGLRPNRPMAGAAATPSGDGYWLVASDGGIFSFGDARFFGSMGAVRLNRPIVGMAATPSGDGYWLVASDGGIFAFGNAPFSGSTGATPLNKPIVGMTATPTGRGYRFVASDGGIFSFGDAPFFGSAADRSLGRPIVGMAASPTGRGYWLAASNGAVLGFGDATVSGQVDSGRLPAPIAAMVAAGTTPHAPTGADPAQPSDDPAPDATPLPPVPPPTGPFEIALIGDTGYTREQDEKLLKARRHMNGFDLSFVVHDGDIKDGISPCTEDRLEYVHDVFDGFAAPLIYTPGDNEWSDCPSPSRELASIRRLFFPSDQSLGQHRLSVTRQGAPFIENAQWMQGNVVFATINLPGPSGDGARGIGTAARDWVNAAFDQAVAAGSPALMIIWQDNPWDGPRDDRLMETLEHRAMAFGKPVVLVHGDTHVHRIDHPWKDVPNFTRVETYALEDTDKWVRVTVDPASPEVFTFTTMRAR